MKHVMTAVRVLLVGAVLAGFAASLTHAKPEYAKKEKAACDTCHVKKSKRLNQLGKCYQEKRSLDVCRAAPSS
jgi:hypothetical protein